MGKRLTRMQCLRNGGLCLGLHAHSMGASRLGFDVFNGIGFLEVLPQVGRVVDIAEHAMTNFTMNLLPFFLVRLQKLAISSRESKIFPNGANRSLEWQ